MNQSTKLSVLYLGIIVCVLLYGYRLWVPAQQYYDEIYFVKMARQYMAGSPQIVDVHPPLGKLLIAGSMSVFGDHPFVWRLPSMVSGVLLVIILYIIMSRLTRNYWISLITAALFAIDGMNITQARIAMLNAPMALFMFLSFLSILPYLYKDDYPRTRALFLSGLCLGIAVSMRWVSLGIVAVLIPLVVYRAMQDEDKSNVLQDLLVCYVLIPLVVYFGSQLIIALARGETWADVWRFQFQMTEYHLKLQEGHRYGSDWWSWPLLIRPIWYYIQKDHSLVQGVLCVGNPAIYWLIPFAMAYVFFEWVEKRKMLHLVILVGFFAQWLPWAFISRVKFFHYFYTAVPFAIMAVVLLGERFWKIEKIGKIIVCSYLVFIFLMFIYWYPLYASVTVPEGFFKHHLWFRSWI